jgi:hypothetical protein
MLLRPGDEFDVRIESGRIVLLGEEETQGPGLPVLTVGRNARLLTSNDVAQILEDFP